MDIKEFFKKLDKVEKKEEIEELFNKLNIEPKYQKDKKKYPDLKFNINTDEIKELKDKGYITNNNLNVSLSEKNLTTLEKLLYALIWKNGELSRIKPIVSGICGEETSTGKVFNQFGKHLCNNEELIIDQHVLRAYIYYKEGNIIKKIGDKVFNKYSNDYKTWINKRKIFKENKNLMDDYLFAIGKKLKEEN